MKISLLQENLLRALLTTGRVVNPRPQLPILQNALLEAVGGRLRVVTTSLDMTEAAWCDGKIEKEGSICVSAKLLAEYVSSLSAQTLTLEAKEGSLLLTSSGSRATLAGVPASEFPPVPTPGKGKTSTIDNALFVDSLSQILLAAASDEARPILSGVRFASKGPLVVITATDGYRLARREVKLGLPQETDVIIPARALAEVARLCREEKEEKGLRVATTDDGQLVFSVGERELFTRRIDGEYPDVNKIVPTSFTTRALVEPETLTRAVKSAAIFARDNANIVRLSIEKDGVIISANAPSIGDNRVEVEAKIEGDGGEIAFNSRFLLELLGVYPEEELVFEMTGSLNPGVFKSPKDPSFVHIIMPVRVQG